MCLFIPSNVSCSRERWLWLLLFLGGYQSVHFQITGFHSPSAGSVSNCIFLLCCLSCSSLSCTCASQMFCDLTCGWNLRSFLSLLPFLLAALGLCCCVWTSLAVAIGGYSLGVVLRFFSLPWLLLLQSMSSGYSGFSSCGSQAWLPLWHVDSSWTRDRTYVPCNGRWTLNHCTTRKSLGQFLKPQLSCLGLSCAGLGVRLTLIFRVRVIPYLPCQISLTFSTY